MGVDELPSQLIGVLSALGSALFWAIAAVFYKLSMKNDISPFLVNFLRIPLAILFIFVVLLVEGQFSLLYLALGNSSFVFYLFLATFVMNIVGDTMYLVSIKKTGVSIAYPLSYSYPIMVALLASFILGESLTVNLIVGVMLGVTGVWLISRKKGESVNVNIFGVIAALLASFSWSLGIILFALSVMEMNPLVTGFYKLVFLTVLVSPSAVYLIRKDANISGRNMLIGMFGGLLGVGIGDWLFYVSLDNIGASVSAALTTSSPLLSLVVSHLYLNEKVGKIQILGTVSIVMGVIVVSITSI